MPPAAGLQCFVARWHLVVVLGWLGFVLGCGGSGLGAQVKGVVTLDGRPIGPGVVTFAPIDSTENPAVGTIQTDGSYFLKTSRERGLQPGTYQVALQINDVPTDLAPGQRDYRPTKSRIPAKYAAVATSDLQFDVQPGSNTINIDMTSP